MGGGNSLNCRWLVDPEIAEVVKFLDGGVLPDDDQRVREAILPTDEVINATIFCETIKLNKFVTRFEKSQLRRTSENFRLHPRIKIYIVL